MALHIPGLDTLESLHADADKLIDAATTLLDGVQKYEGVLSLLGLSAELPAVEKIDAVLKTLKAALDKVPV